MSHAHEALDGERSLGSLDAAERAEAAELEQGVAEAVAPILAEPVPDFRREVMARVIASGWVPPASLEEQPGRPWLRLLWQPRSVTLRIRPALAAAAVLALLLPIGRLIREPAPVSVATVAGPASIAAVPVLYVRFRLDSPGARSVALAGSFTDWSPSYELRETAPGVWSALVPLEPGVHDYGFVVDGDRWVPDPLAAQVSDGYGGSNSQLAILPTGQIL